MLKLSLGMLVLLWCAGAFSSHSFSGYTYLFLFLATGFVLMKLLRSPKAQPHDGARPGVTAESHRYRI